MAEEEKKTAADQNGGKAEAARKRDKDKKIKKKKDASKNMIEYTYRDSGQEYIMRKKMLRAIVYAIMLAIALIVFIALYISETRKVQETYRRQYRVGLDAMMFDINDYAEADGDFELRYRMMVADMSTVNSFAFLLDDFVNEQKSINGLYTCFIKYPEQMKERLPEVGELIQSVINIENDAYDHIDEFVETINKKGF